MIVDTILMELRLPQDKVVNIQKECSIVIAKTTITLRTLMRLIGKMTATIPAVLEAPLHYRFLQAHTNQLRNQGIRLDDNITLTHLCKEDISWWIHQLPKANGKKLKNPIPKLTLETDASKTGWGAITGKIGISGKWSLVESHQHINLLELRAMGLALKTFCKHMSHCHILIKSDNQVAVRYINTKGGTHSLTLNKEAIQIWTWCRQRNLTIQAEYLLGSQNEWADAESRKKAEMSDWRLDPVIFQQLQQVSGPLEIDLFAARHNTQLENYFSWHPDPDAQGTDAFKYSWTTLKGYAFPPFCLVGRCLRKVIADKVWRLVVIAPVWPHQVWYPLLLDLLVEPPILLTQSATLLQDPKEHTSPPSSRQSAASQLDCVVQQLDAKGVSKDAAELIQASWRKGTQKSYATAWGKWCGWCDRRETDPVSAPMKYLLDFITEEFKNGKQYSTLNTYRSAISATHVGYSGTPAGQHPLVCRLLQGIFNSRPPMPKNVTLWDVEIALKHAESIFPLEELSLKQISERTAMLLALANADRVSDLHSLDLKFRCYRYGGVSFIIPVLTKTRRSGPPREVFYAQLE